MQLSYLDASEADFDVLVQLRIEAMRESLERIGRFDLGRSVERFRASFIPVDTKKILCDDHLVGFYSVTRREDHLHLSHLYVKPAYQSLGIGSAALKKVIELSTKSGLPIRLEALKESRSNEFYRDHGFVMTSEDEWDTYYERPVESDPS